MIEDEWRVTQDTVSNVAAHPERDGRWESLLDNLTRLKTSRMFQCSRLHCPIRCSFFLSSATTTRAGGAHGDVAHHFSYLEVGNDEVGVCYEGLQRGLGRTANGVSCKI